MNDINGTELAVGDNVIYTNRNLNELHKGVINRITKTQVIIQLKPTVTHQSTLHDGTIYKWKSKYEHIITYGEQIMKLG